MSAGGSEVGIIVFSEGGTMGVLDGVVVGCSGGGVGRCPCGGVVGCSACDCMFTGFHSGRVTVVIS